jgi:hypothetical protein
MNFRLNGIWSNGVRSNGVSVKWPYGQNFSVKLFFGSDPEPRGNHDFDHF